MTRHHVRKHREVAFVDLLRTSTRELSGAQLRESEAPDFLLDSANRTIGVEVTELNVSSGRQRSRERESLEDSVAIEASRVAQARGLPLLSVFLFFNNQLTYRKSDRTRIAHGLVDTVERNIPEIGGHRRVDRESNNTPQPREVDLIIIYRDSNAPRGRWQSTKASWVQQDCVATFQEALSAKTGKYINYRTKCDECWLILGAEGTRQSSAIRPNPASLQHEYESTFDKVFFVRLVDRQCNQLRVRTIHAKSDG